MGGAEMRDSSSSELLSTAVPLRLELKSLGAVSEVKVRLCQTGFFLWAGETRPSRIVKEFFYLGSLLKGNCVHLVFIVIQPSYKCSVTHFQAFLSSLRYYLRRYH